MRVYCFWSCIRELVIHLLATTIYVMQQQKLPKLHFPQRSQSKYTPRSHGNFFWYYKFYFMQFLFFLPFFWGQITWTQDTKYPESTKSLIVKIPSQLKFIVWEKHNWTKRTNTVPVKLISLSHYLHQDKLSCLFYRFYKPFPLITHSTHPTPPKRTDLPNSLTHTFNWGEGGKDGETEGEDCTGFECLGPSWS